MGKSTSKAEGRDKHNQPVPAPEMDLEFVPEPEGSVVRGVKGRKLNQGLVPDGMGAKRKVSVRVSQGGMTTGTMARRGHLRTSVKPRSNRSCGVGER